MSGPIEPRSLVACAIRRADGSVTKIDLRCRIDTRREAAWFASGGILKYVLKKMGSDSN